MTWFGFKGIYTSLTYRVTLFWDWLGAELFLEKTWFLESATGY